MASSPAYGPPTPLEDLHILDYLELAGSQARAGESLAMHQSTVCRRLRQMRKEFGRKGDNPCLVQLRLAYRAHRLMAGVLRLGTDGWHQGLLSGMAGVQPVPPRARAADHWAALVRRGLLDGAIVSSLCLAPGQTGEEPRWEGLAVVPLGLLDLQLLAPVARVRGVLLPPRQAAPLLHQLVRSQGLRVEPLPAPCQEPAAWIQRARERALAIPLCPQLQGARELQPVAGPPPLRETLWLVLAGSIEGSSAAKECAQLLRQRLKATQLICCNIHADSAWFVD